MGHLEERWRWSQVTSHQAGNIPAPLLQLPVAAIADLGHPVLEVLQRVLVPRTVPAHNLQAQVGVHVGAVLILSAHAQGQHTHPSAYSAHLLQGLCQVALPFQCSCTDFCAGAYLFF